MSRLSSQLRFNDLTGGINNVYDKEMINSSTRKTETPDMVNVEYFRLGGIKTMEGNTLVGGDRSIQDSAVIGGWEYTKGNKKYMIIGLANGEVRRYNEGVQDDNRFELIYTFPSQSPRMSFCNMNNGVVITNGIDDLIFYEFNRPSNLTGDIQVNLDESLVTGIGTRFKKELKVGDGLLIAGRTYYIQSITDNYELFLTEPISYLETHEETYYDEELEEYITVVVTDHIYDLKFANTSLCNATLVNTNTDVDTTGSVNVKIRGLAIQYYKGRLYVGTEQGLFYSPVGEYNNWNIQDDAGVFYDIYNDSSEVTALGLYSDYMLVHKKFNTYILSDSGNGAASDSLSINPFSNITCDSQQSWIVSNTRYYIYSKEFMDIYPLVQRTIYNDRFLGEPITQKVREIFKDLEEYNIKNIFCVSRPKQRQMIFYMPTNNVSGSGEALIFDFQTKSWLLRRLPNWTEVDTEGNSTKCITDVTCAFNFDNNIYIGTRDGLVLKEFTSRSFKVLVDGEIKETGLHAYYKSPWFDWAGNYYQSFAEFFIEVNSDYKNRFIIRTQKDGTSRYEDRLIDEDRFVDKTNALVWDDESKHWGGINEDTEKEYKHDNWAKITFDTLRMLLPNNVFESFQFELKADRVGDGFHIYQYGFRRIETEEAPW